MICNTETKAIKTDLKPYMVLTSYLKPCYKFYNLCFLKYITLRMKEQLAR